MKLNTLVVIFTFACFTNILFSEDPWSVSADNPVTNETFKPQEKIRFDTGRLSLSNLIVSAYRKYISPIDGETCRFHPTCSVYTSAALKKYGPIKGALMGADRLLRCHPGNKTSSYDPLKDY